MRFNASSAVSYTDGNNDTPAVFLAQFRCNQEPWLTAQSCAAWAKANGYGGVQLPGWESGLISLVTAVQSKDYCENDVMGPFTAEGVAVTHIANHLHGQLVAINPTLAPLFEGFGPKEFAGFPNELSKWAIERMMLTVKAAANCGHKTVFAFPGSFLWPFVYPWPQRPLQLVKAAMKELARRWKPILDLAHSLGIRIAFEIHPGEDIFDGATFEMFLEAVGKHPALAIAYDPSHFVLQGLDYLKFIDDYHNFIAGAHWKDAELVPSGKQGVYSGLQEWAGRAGRFRSLGDGQIDFVEIEKRFHKYGLNLWRVLEWECCIKGRRQGAAEGAKVLQAIIDDQIIPKFADVIPHTDVFDAFAGVTISKAMLERCLGFRIPLEDAIELGLAT